MIKKYYVAVRPQTNDLHAVHQEGCPFLPDDGKSIFLGNFKSGKDAVRMSARHYSDTGSCLFCCKENISMADNLTGSRLSGQDVVSLNPEVPVSFMQSMLCCLN
jgi:hypothetical protein